MPLDMRGSQEGSQEMYSEKRIHVTESPVASWDTSSDKSRTNSAYSSILLAAALVSLPMIAFSALLLGIIFGYRTGPDKHSLEGLKPAIQNQTIGELVESAEQRLLEFYHLGGNSAYIVEFKATKLTAIVSWVGRIAGWLSSSVMTLASYVAARQMLDHSRKQRDHALPTPYQVSLFLQLLGGGMSSLWYSSKYRLAHRREKFAPPVLTALGFAVFVILLGQVISAVDTWLSVTITPITIPKVASHATSQFSYGRGIFDNVCANDSGQVQGPVDMYVPCSVSFSPSHYQATGGAVLSSNEGYSTVSNISSRNLVLTHELNGKNYAFLTDPHIGNTLDFRARTFALTTECKPITHTCQAGFAYWYNFSCTPSFTSTFRSSGNPLYANSDPQYASDGGVGVQFFVDPDLNNNGTDWYVRQNPLYFATWATVSTIVYNVDPLYNDRDIVHYDNAMVTSSWILSCASTAYEVEYSWVNGSMQDFVLMQANSSMAGLIAAPIVSNLAGTQLESAAVLSSFVKTAQELANAWSTSFSRIALGLSAGVMSPRPNIEEQVRSFVPGASVPKLPLYTLLGLSLLYPVLGLVIACSALLSSRLAETHDVKNKLSVSGLAAAAFEAEPLTKRPVDAPEDLFFERRGTDELVKRKVGFAQSDVGGWAFVSGPPGDMR